MTAITIRPIIRRVRTDVGGERVLTSLSVVEAFAVSEAALRFTVSFSVASALCRSCVSVFLQAFTFPIVIDAGAARASGCVESGGKNVMVTSERDMSELVLMAAIRSSAAVDSECCSTATVVCSVDWSAICFCERQEHNADVSKMVRSIRNRIF